MMIFLLEIEIQESTEAVVVQLTMQGGLCRHSADQMRPGEVDHAFALPKHAVGLVDLQRLIYAQTSWHLHRLLIS